MGLNRCSLIKFCNSKYGGKLKSFHFTTFLDKEWHLDGSAEFYWCRGSEFSKIFPLKGLEIRHGRWSNKIIQLPNMVLPPCCSNGHLHATNRLFDMFVNVPHT